MITTNAWNAEFGAVELRQTFTTCFRAAIAMAEIGALLARNHKTLARADKA